MAATLLIPTALRGFADGAGKVVLEGGTAGALIRSLGEQFPDIVPHLFDEEGNLRSYVNVFIGEVNIRDLDGLDSAVADGSEVSIVPAIAGGCGGSRV
ncbi:MAG: MoaD/ThiS family protein [Clostridiales Family XIII bacterium]|nr:MoaD/ThiS family protein [Clostridiales Family XIII bacterium]